MPGRQAAEADAALMDGHAAWMIDSPSRVGRGGRRGPDGWTLSGVRDAVRWRRAAEADAALMDGHHNLGATAIDIGAAEADAALMDGHFEGAGEQDFDFKPRRPTRP